MRLFGIVNGSVNRYDRAEWLTPPFDLSYPTTGTRANIVVGDYLPYILVIGDSIGTLMVQDYDIGDNPTLFARFTSLAGELTDPTAVILKVTTPGGTTITYTYGTDAALVKHGTGEYYLNYLPPAAGTYSYKWYGTGDAYAAEEKKFVVRDTNIL